MSDTGLILFVDTETTGLKPEKHLLLEVGFVLTDFDLDEKARFSAVLRPPPPTQLAEIVLLCRENNAFAYKKHTENGLLAEVETLYARQATEGGDIGGYRSTQDAALQWLMEETGGVSLKPYIGGRSVGFDRGFLAKYMPLFYNMLSHRDVNVSSFYAVWEAWTGLEPPKHADLAPKGSDAAKHRVMTDLEETIAEARVYKGALNEWGRIARKADEDPVFKKAFYTGVVIGTNPDDVK